MSQESFVIDLRALAKDGRRLEGEVPVARLARLAESVLEPRVPWFSVSGRA
jgi:hypothetical protein